MLPQWKEATGTKRFSKQNIVKMVFVVTWRRIMSRLHCATTSYSDVGVALISLQRG